MAKLLDCSTQKIFRSENYNYNFSKETGRFVRWGKDIKDDPQYSPYGSEIFDVEIVEGPCSGRCVGCYKMNNLALKNKYMTVETFSKILDKLPRVDGKLVLTQVALGITDLSSNPDLYKIMDVCLENGVIPNITINGNQLNSYHLENLAKRVGAISVSDYGKDLCYGAVEKLHNAGIDQINIHKIIHSESVDSCIELMNDAKTDPRLSGLNAIVFMSYKHKNEHSPIKPLRDKNEFIRLAKHALDSNINFGFDSCGAHAFGEALKELGREDLSVFVEPCESFGMFSAYCNTDGVYFPCSFCEDLPLFEGINLLEINDFLKDVWFNDKLVALREKASTCGRKCIAYNLDLE